MNNGFNIYLPLEKSGDCELTGIASTTSIDRDTERMSEKALRMMVDEIKKNKINLFADHEHGIFDTLGVVKDAELINNQVHVKIDLDDSSTNPKVPALLNKMKKGILCGMSVGGNVTKDKWEYDKALGKKVHILDEVQIYELSIVGILSKSDSFTSLPNAIIKSVGTKCPVCFSKMKETCNVCFYNGGK